MHTALFDRTESEALRDEAMACVDENADEAWKAAALNAVHWTAKYQAVFTTDDVWKRLLGKPHEPRAMGAVMRKAKDLGWIAPTDRFIATEKISQHRQPIRQWRSLLCAAPPNSN